MIREDFTDYHDTNAVVEGLKDVFAVFEGYNSSWSFGGLDI